MGLFSDIASGKKSGGRGGSDDIYEALSRFGQDVVSFLQGQNEQDSEGRMRPVRGEGANNQLYTPDPTNPTPTQATPLPDKPSTPGSPRSGWQAMASQGAEPDPYDQNISRSREIMSGMPDIPTKSEFREQRGIKDPNFWQSLALGAAYGGPQGAKQAFDTRVKEEYQDFIQPQMSERASAERELEFLEKTRPEYVRRVPITIGDFQFVLPENQIGFFAGAIRDISERAANEQDKLPVRAILEGAGMKGAGIYEYIPENMRMDPDSLSRLVQAMASARERGRNLEQAAMEELGKPPEERNEEILDVWREVVQADIEGSGGKYNLQEWFRRDPEAAMNYERSMQRVREEANPEYSEVDPAELDTETAKALVEAYNQDRGGHPLALYTSRVVNDNDIQSVSRADRSGYAKNYLLTQYRESPRYRDWAENQMINQGLFFKGHRLYGSKKLGVFEGVRQDLDKVISQTKNSESDNKIDWRDSNRFLLETFPKEYAEYKSRTGKDPFSPPPERKPREAPDTDRSLRVREKFGIPKTPKTPLPGGEPGG